MTSSRRRNGTRVAVAIEMSSSLFLLSLFVLSGGCAKEERLRDDGRADTVDSPLVTVIKLELTENAGDFDAARAFLDVDEAYGPYVSSEYPRPDDVWKSMVNFHNSLARDKKFTNAFGYHNYDVVEYPKGDRHVVDFRAKDRSDRIRVIRYVLERDAAWKVVGIEWVKSPEVDSEMGDRNK